MTQHVTAHRDDDADVIVVGAGPSGGALNTGSIFVELAPKRKAKADAIIARLRPKLAKIAGINLYLQATQDVRIGGRSSRTQYQYTLQDANLDELRQWGPKILEKLRTLPALKDVVSDQQTAGLELGVPPERINTIAAFGPQAQGAQTVGGWSAGNDELAEVARLLAENELVLPIDSIYPIERTAEAYGRLEAGHVRGKIVIVTD